MREPLRRELSFLIEALHLNPDDFFEELYRGKEYRPFRSSAIDNGEFFERIIDPGTCDRKAGFDNLLGDTIRRMTRNNVGIMDLRLFNDDTVDAWDKFVHENEWKSAGSEHASIFEFIRKIGENCLIIQDGKIYFKIDQFKTWQHVSFHCGEDLFIAAMLADNNINHNYCHKHYQWGYILKSDFFALNALINHEKIVDNHFHLGGSAPMVDLSWIYLMNHPYGQQAKYREFWKLQESFYQLPHSQKPSRQSDLETLVKIAAEIRLSLFKKTIYNKKIDLTLYHIYLMLNGASETTIGTDKIESDIELLLYDSPFSAFDVKVDYAIINSTHTDKDLNCSYISGERFFLYHCLKYIYEHPKDSFLQTLFYLYLLIKHYFDSMFIQSNNKTGFHNFKEYNERKGCLLDNKYKQMAINMAIQGNFTENCLEQLEVRIPPEDKTEKFRKSINQKDSRSYFRSTRITQTERLFPFGLNGNKERLYGNGTDRHFYVIHFIKQKNPQWYEDSKYRDAPLCRESKKREQYKLQAQTLMQLRVSGDEVCSRVFGIDAASNEVHFRPENFGTAFRYLSSYKILQDVPWERKIPDLRKTYHVGEDFFDIIDGLRAIDEAVKFLELSQGDRIGHGVALGIDVDEWYNRHGKIALPRQNKLDNTAWLLDKIRHWKIETTTAYYQDLTYEFEKLYHEVYNEDSPGIKKYIEAWELRGDDPECYFSHVPDPSYLKSVTQWDKYMIRDKKLFMQHAKVDDKVYNIYHRYHFDTDLKKRAIKSVTQEFKPEYIRLVKEIQARMRSYIAEKSIAVESCPMSNYLISNLDEFKEVPTFQLFPVHEEPEKGNIRLNVCVNTDDQGVFYTSLVKEYTMLAAIMHEETIDGKRKYSDNVILSWIKHLIDNSKQFCFRTGDVRYYGIRSGSPISKNRPTMANNEQILPLFFPD